MKKEKNIKETIFEAESNNILMGQYPIAHIVTEKYLCEKYGASRAPVREALSRLCADKLLISIPRCGYQITEINLRDLEEALAVRCILELGALELSFPHLGETELASLEKRTSIAHGQTFVRTPRNLWLNNVKFHQELCGYSQNDYLLKTLNGAIALCTRGAMRHFQATRVEPVVADESSHGVILQRIREGALEDAKRALKEDILLLRKTIQYLHQ